ncbi:MAG TPA: orotidine-5'-phosphate decarboxylase [Puia sp.]|nr:orotidine-5'-phosphate decarboxylase [Puia sp.]
MTRQELVSSIRSKGSYLSVGLDTDPDKLPRHFRDRYNEKGVADAIVGFNRQIIDATAPHCVAYKINTAFYEAMGVKGWEAMERTVNYIPATHLRIADAKRGDIGNTSAQYARAFFETMPFDAITVTPYMGEDSVRPFLEYKDKWTIVLGLTSNPGAADFELQRMGSAKAEHLYERVLTTAAEWSSPDNMMFVIGATQAEAFERVRRLMPDHFFLVPGVGAQGGDLEEISRKVMNKDVGLLVNASRAVIYASVGEDFAAAAGRVAAAYRHEMHKFI